MEEYVTRIGDVTIQRVIPGGAGPAVEPVRVMESEELLRAVKEEPLDDDEEEEEEEGEGEGEEEEAQGEAVVEGGEEEKIEDQIRVKEEPRDEEEEDENENEVDETESRHSEEKETNEGEDEEKDEEDEDNENGKRKADSDEDSENLAKKKKMENELEADKKKISNLRRNIREVMDEAQLDEATLAAQRQEAERLRRVQDQQKYLREVRQIQLNKQNSKTQSRVISLLQGGSTSLLKSSAVSSSISNSSSSGPSTVLVKLGSGQQQALNRKTLEVLRGTKTLSSTEASKPGITRVTPGNRPAMVTPSVSIAPVKPIVPEGQKKDPCDADVVTISSSSDSEDDCILISEGEGEEEEEEDDVDTTNSGMHTNDLYNIPDEQGRVLINVGKPESEHEIYLAPQIARIIKPHQIGGVRFLFDNVVESIERFNNSTGFGCILAHSMGLGKTLQVVSFCDVFLRETSAKTVMCIMPINTLQNWMAEFNLWLPNDPTASPLAVHGEIRPRNFGIFVLNDMHKTISARAKVVEEWNREGGVLLIGYEMYRQLSLKRPGRIRKGKKRPPDEDVEDEKNKPLLEAMHEALVRPGPDLVICDEGHRIKNSHASISHALKQIRTKRRVVLTGYPLQNNLLEYWCMVDFVRPNYLGTKTEFSNMFERPIQNGQCIDSTPQDIRLMRYRAHVLHSLLEGFVQRRSHSVLRNTLPQKEEYVILVRMTSFQRKLYDTFMNEVVRTKAVPNPLKAFAVCCKIWNHPDILYNFIKKKELDELQDLDIEETANLHTGPNSPRRPLTTKEKKGKTMKKQAQVAAIKPEVAAPAQPQVANPEVKTDDRKFDFPPHSQNTPSGPPGYGEYYPPPPYSDMSYQYHRPPAPGMYYPSYYQESPGFYPGYESGYPGYYGNFGQYSGSKSEEFDKQAQPWGNNYGGNKEKSVPKSPKDFESSKPGYQEFYPIKEEKPDIKEEKQQYLCGFSGGQVSYNYRGYGGYSDYPYPQQDYPSGWNKGSFSNYSHGETAAAGNTERTAPISSSDNSVNIVGDQKSESAHKLKTGEDRSHAPHMIHERNKSNQNMNETHLLHSSADQQRLLNHQGGNQNLHATQGSMQPNRMVSGQLSDDQQRRSTQDHVSSNQQGHFVNQRSDSSLDTLTRNQDNLMRSRTSQETDPHRLHSNNHVHNSQNLLSTHDQLQRSQSGLYGSKGVHENEYGVACNQERLPSGQPMFSTMPSNKDYLPSNQNLNSRQTMPEKSRVQGNQDQNSAHQQSNFSSQRPEHMIHGEHIEESQVRTPNSQERSMFGVQDVQKSSRNLQNVHDGQHRITSSKDHLSANQQNMFVGQRGDHSMRGSQDHISSTQQNMFGNQRSEHGMQIISQEHALNNQKTMFENQRGEQNIQVNPDNIPSAPQNMYLNSRNEHNIQVNLENQKNNQQNIFGTHRSEINLQCNSEQMPTSHHKQINSDHTQQNVYGNQQRSEHNIQNNLEHLSGIQQNIYSKQRDENNLQQNSEQMPTGQQDMFGNQRTELNVHVNTDNLPGSQQNIFGNERTDHGVQVSQDHMSFSHHNVGNQVDNQRRGHMGQEHLALSHQQNMFSAQRNDHAHQTNREHMQCSPSGNQEKDMQHRAGSNQDRLTGNQQLFGNARKELIPGNSDHMHLHQERFIGNQNIHELDSNVNNLSLKPATSQTMFAGQRIDHNARINQEQNMQEHMSQDRFSGGHNRFGSQDTLQGQQGMFRGQNVHDKQHKLHSQMSQQTMYGNQLIDRGVLGGQDIQNNSQGMSSHSHLQASKRSSTANDHMPVTQQESYGNHGNDHSMQKIMKTDNQLENHQVTRSIQECPQFSMFSNPEGQYHNSNHQEAIQGSRSNIVDSQNSPESSNRMHMSRDRHLGSQPHNTQDQKSSQSLFSNQNAHDSQRWLHNNQELSGSQQNLFNSHGTHQRDDPFQLNQNLHGSKTVPENKQHKFHNSQECMSLSQQNMFVNQSNQTAIQRQEHMLGKQQNKGGTQNVQENQYRMGACQEHQQNAMNAIERQGLHSSQDSIHSSPQNIMGRKNTVGHQNTQGIASNQVMYGNQLQRNIQGNPEYQHNNPSGNISATNTTNMHLSRQQGGLNTNQTHALPGNQHSSTAHNQEMLKGNQNISGCQGYGLQNASSQLLSAHESRQGSQSGVLPGQQSMLNNQSRPQHGVMSSQEIQQGSSNDNISRSQHNSYENQFHITNSQQNMQCVPNPSHHMQGPQPNMNSSNANTPMFGNQAHVQPHQSQLTSSAIPSLMHNKDLPQGSQGLDGISNFGGSHTQYMTTTSQQNVAVTSHSLHGDNLQNSKLNNPSVNISGNHNFQSQHNVSSSQTNPINKADQQKIQGSPQNVPSYQHKMNVNQQGTQTGPDHASQMTATQHRVQNMLGQTGTHQQTQNSFDQTIIMSNKGMSGGQVMQGSQLQKVGQKSEDQSRFKGQFDDQFQNNYSKPGFFGQDYHQFPYQNQFPYQENQFNEQPGPSGQKFRKEDDKCEDGKSKEIDKKTRDGEEGTKAMSTSSTNTEKDDEREKKDKKDDEDNKTEKKETTSKATKEDPGIPYDWAVELLKGYVPGDISASAKMAVFFCILEESIALGDRILVFSQSLFTLNLMEELLQQQFIPGREEKWARNVNYYRLDGSTTAMEREKLINEFNSNSNLHLFLVSTRAGSLGINLVGANRVIVFDASWNPCHDTQAVCRVYRYGQKKPCFVYRLVTDNCLEKKIYDRQINKQGMSDRVVDECNPDAHLSIKEVTSLCWDDKTDDESPKDFSSLQDSYIDVVLQKVIQKHSNFLSKEPFQHESLLVDRKEKKLSQAEKRLAKRSYELEKQATTRPVYNGVQQNQARPKPMASVRPMQAEMGQTRQRGWIPASVWQRQGMSAQEMTLPLDVVIPTNAADRSSIVLKAGQKVMVLKSPKGIYMQLENGKIIAIRTTFKVGAKKPGEQQGKGTEMGRRGGRQQMISPRGRPVRAVGPVSRPPPVTVTVTRKRPPEEEQTVARREEGTTPSTGSAPLPPTAPVPPMEVAGAEKKDAPNPFTAAAAASLSSMQQYSQPSVPQQSTSQVQHPQNQLSQQSVQHTEQPLSQSQQPSIQSQQTPAQYPQQQPQHLQLSMTQAQQPSQIQQQTLPQQQVIPPQPITQQQAISSQQPQSTQHSHLSQQVPQSQLQQQPLVPIPHSQHPHQHPQAHLPQLPPQLQQPIAHQLPSQAIPSHSQLAHQSQHSQHAMSVSPLQQQTISHPQLPQQPITHPQQSHQSQTHHPMLSMSHSQMQSHPLPPHSQMLQTMPPPHAQLPQQSIPHMQMSQQSLPQPQFSQQQMLHQVQHPQHYEPPPIPPLVGDQLT